MLRLVFQKTGNAVWISHLDLMRLFQRAFKRADLPLTHTQGYNPRPSVSIALPLSVGMESNCELLDFELEREVPCQEICDRLNKCLVEGVRVLQVYEDGRKLKHLSLLLCSVRIFFDIPFTETSLKTVRELFAQEEILVIKKTKNGPQEQNIAPMIKKVMAEQSGEKEMTLQALICCQNPSLNPAQLFAAVEAYLPQLQPGACICRREEIYDEDNTVFR